MSLFRPMLLRANLAAYSKPTCLRAAALRYSTSTSCENVILPRLQTDLKLAMRSKNKPALNTIRALQAEIINASKTAKPIETDGALYTLVQKQIKASKSAIEEFQAAKREDLVTKEQAQLAVLQAYADEIPTMQESEIDGLIQSVLDTIGEGKKTVGSVIGQVVTGGIKGRPYNVEYLRKKIEEVLGTK
ncbi:GatB/YqeY domain-containing protein [Plenodomus tracheiphilus IPT5]|uniref:Altered inheritance of mitochondria protein 41 n=1 Tax=Plenodomus tracheiphilus IPT5 TaxID=1408161 RepID=A0A6A7AMX8_9PLEO|nr:GatB/YqeY domain-containing protein [Plenodomus tracheiphilus IPT5]